MSTFVLIHGGGDVAWPLDALPDVPTRFILCTEDRFFPAAFMRRVVTERLGIVPDEIAAGHCVALSRPVELARLPEEAGRRRRPRLQRIDHYDDELRPHNERLRAAAGVRPGDRVLDIGRGAGQSTRDAARDAAPGSVLGVDISEELLERARHRTVEQGVHNATYERGDAQDHPFPPASFVLDHFAYELRSALAEPGERIVDVLMREPQRAQATIGPRCSME